MSFWKAVGEISKELVEIGKEAGKAIAEDLSKEFDSSIAQNSVMGIKAPPGMEIECAIDLLDFHSYYGSVPEQYIHKSTQAALELIKPLVASGDIDARVAQIHINSYLEENKHNYEKTTNEYKAIINELKSKALSDPKIAGIIIKLICREFSPYDSACLIAIEKEFELDVKELLIYALEEKDPTTLYHYALSLHPKTSFSTFKNEVLGIEHDAEKAMLILYQLTAKGNANACLTLMLDYEEEPRERFELLCTAAKLNSSRANFFLAREYRLGIIVTKDTKMADVFSRRAARLGNAAEWIRQFLESKNYQILSELMNNSSLFEEHTNNEPIPIEDILDRDALHNMGLLD
jgi:TPR repeat protein